MAAHAGKSNPQVSERRPGWRVQARNAWDSRSFGRCKGIDSSAKANASYTAIFATATNAITTHTGCFRVLAQPKIAAGPQDAGGGSTLKEFIAMSVTMRQMLEAGVHFG